jgi:DNA-binding beta-propeller fold protein YncE
MRLPSRRPERDAHGRYWTALVHGAPAEELARLAEPLDPTTLATIERVRALQRVRRRHADPVFVARLERDLMNAMVLSSSVAVPLRPAAPSAANGRLAPEPGTGRLPALPLVRQPRGWALARVAVALLAVLALTGGAALVRFGWPGGAGDHRASIPAPLLSPDATPPVGGLELLWQTRGDPADPMKSASFFAIAPDGTIWVPDDETNRIRIFSPDGALLDTFGGPGTGEGQFHFGPFTFPPSMSFGAIAFDAAGNAYVLDVGNHRVQKFGPDRAFLTAWGSEGLGDGQFVFPTDIAVDGQGRVFVIDGSHLDFGTNPAAGTFIQVFDSDGKFLFDWGENGTVNSGPDKLKSSWGIGFAPDGTILIADSEYRIIQRFTAEGTYIDTLGGSGSDVQFLRIWDAAVDIEGRIFTADALGEHVTVLDRDGRFLATLGKPDNAERQFVDPIAVALDGEGNLYVIDDDGRLQKFRLPPLPATPVA